MPPVRKSSYDSMVQSIGVPVELITDDTMKKYEKSELPFHPAYQYLSGTHKCDYLRTYLMCLYGGGYSDIKPTSESWVSAFQDIESNPNIWVNGYPEPSPTGLALPADNPERAEDMKKHYRELVGNGAYIVRAGTELANLWIKRLHAKLDEKLPLLKENPAKHERDGETDSSYPIGWTEVLGSIFHDICFDYRNHLAYTVPPPKFTDYRG